MKTLIQLFILVCLAPLALKAQLFENYAVFDGSGDYLFCDNVLPNGNFTVEFYFRECDDDDLNVFRNLVTNGDDFTHAIKKQFEDEEFHFADRTCVGDLGGGCGSGDVAILTSVEGNEWHHMALIYNKSEKCISTFYDGVDYSGVCSSEYGLSSKDLYIGKAFFLWVSSQGFRGQVEEIRVSNNLRYTSTFIPPTSNFIDDAHTIAIWHLDTIAAGIIEDASGGGFNLIANGDVHLFNSPFYVPTISGEVLVNIDEIYTYSSPDIPDYMSIIWDSEGATITPGLNDTAYISWPDTGMYTLTLTISDETLCDVFSTAINIHVIEQEDCIPSIEICNLLDDNCNGIIDDGITETINISAAGGTTFCQGGSVVLNAIFSGTSIQWKKGGVNIIGATESSFTATQKGIYTCETTSNCGNTLSNSINVIVNKNPNAAISAEGPTTFCEGGSVTLIEIPSGGSTYQWYKGPVPIPGASSTSYIATTSGNYKCRVTKTATGCFKTSNVVPVNVTCRLGESDEPILLYPNPVIDNLILEYPVNYQGLFTIYTVNGQLVYSIELTNSIMSINVSKYPPGLYLLKYQGVEGEFIKQFTKISH